MYVHGSDERFMQAAKGDKVDGSEAGSVLKKVKKEKRLQDQEDKALHGQYLRETKQARKEQSWVGLQNGDLIRETESLIITAQNQSIKINLVKRKIDKILKDTLCRLRKKADESIADVVSGCSRPVQKECERRNEELRKKVMGKPLAGKCDFEAKNKWYEHNLESGLENEKYKILWISVFRLIIL